MRSQVARKQVSATTTRNLRKLLLDILAQAGAGGIEVGIGERIKQARLEAGLTQDQLADLVGVGMRQIQYYEADESAPYRTINQIAAATGKPVPWLLRGGPLEQEEGGVGEELRRLQDEVRGLRDLLEERLPPAEDEPAADKLG